MAPATPNHLGSPSRRKRPYTSSAESSPARPSPRSTPKISKKKRRRKEPTPEPEPDSEFYAIKGIIREKKEDGRVLYLLQWEDHPDTRESYPNSWEPRENVTDDAIREWKERKRLKKATLRGNRNDRVHEAEAGGQDQHIHGSEVNHGVEEPRIIPIGSPSQSPSKNPRRAGTVQSARFQSVSQESVHKPQSPREIKDSYEDEQNNESAHFRVEVPHLGSDFDYEAYAKVSIASSQVSQQIHSSLGTAPRNRFKNPKNRAFIWDEDTPIVIPDSHEPGSSSHHPATTIDTEPSEPTGDAGTQFLAQSSGEASSQSECLSTSSNQPLSENSFEPSSSRVEVAIGSVEYSSQPVSQPSLEAAEASQIEVPSAQPLQYTYPEGEIDGSQVLGSSGDQHIASQIPPGIVSSSEVQPSYPEIQLFHALQIEETSCRASRTSGSQESETNLQFHTQIPFNQRDYEQDTINSDSNRLDSIKEPQNCEQNTGSQLVACEAPDSQTLRPESRGDESDHRHISGFEESWQPAQVVSQICAPTESSDAQQSRGFTQVIGTVSPVCDHQGEYSQAIPVVISQPQIEESSYSVYQSSNNILPSIERVEYTSSDQSHLSSGSGRQDLKSAPPLSQNMEESTSMSVAELLKQQRAKTAASLLAAQSERRAASLAVSTPPSASPALPPVSSVLPSTPDVTITSAHSTPSAQPKTPIQSPPPAEVALHSPINQTIVSLDEIEVPGQSAPSPIVSVEIEPIETRSQVQSLGPEEFIVPLPMVGTVRSIADIMIKNSSRSIRKFLNDSIVEIETLDEMKELIERLKLCCDHQWLVEDDTSSQEQMSDAWVAKYCDNSSTKCIFLFELLDSLRLEKAHVVIFVRPGRMLRILAAFLRYHSFAVTRPDEPATSDIDPLLQITLLSTNLDEGNLTIRNATLVVAFDSSFATYKLPPNLRMGNGDQQELVPLIHLVVSHSAEHLELCFDKDFREVDRITGIIHVLKNIREEYGILSPEFYGPDKAGRAVASFTASKGSQPWPLLPIALIEEVDQLDFESLIGIPSQPSGSTTQTHNTQSLGNSPRLGYKRTLMTEDESDCPKRQRIATSSGQTAETFTAHGNLNSSNGVVNDDSVDRHMADPDDIVDEKDDILASLTKRVRSVLLFGIRVQHLTKFQVKQLELQLQEKEASEAELLEQNRELQLRCNEYDASFERIQPKYQEALIERADADHQMKLAVTREQKTNERYNKAIAELNSLREAKAVVEAELATANSALANSTVPGLAEMQKLKDDLVVAQKQADAAQRRADSLQGTLNYTQQSYQTASNAAATATSEAAELKEEKKKLSRRASENAVLIHEINNASQAQQLAERIDQLEKEKESVEQMLERKMEELRNLQNGRRATRGASVPRSPRMSTMSPRSGVGRVLGGNSRGNSPAPGEVQVGVGRREQFGDALLFPNAGPQGRWPNHNHLF
ncbi:hypothetical protein B0O99DRAFT_632156 [Bisporella sp. PMI_857]|nr:hypothetical protein B0O99DRAFT_632156 [Bisporella sp. PMI_857]